MCNKLLSLPVSKILYFPLYLESLIIICLDVGLFNSSYLEFTEILTFIYSCLSSSVEVYSHYFFKYCPPFSFSYPSQNAKMHVLVYQMVSHRHLRLCLLPFNLFLFFFPNVIIAIVLYPCLLSLFSACSNMSLNSSEGVFYFTQHTFKILNLLLVTLQVFCLFIDAYILFIHFFFLTPCLPLVLYLQQGRFLFVSLLIFVLFCFSFLNFSLLGINSVLSTYNMVVLKFLSNRSVIRSFSVFVALFFPL